jgi:hypothetical protein
MNHVVYISRDDYMDPLEIQKTLKPIDAERNAKAILAWLLSGVGTPTFDATARLLGLTYAQLSEVCDACYQDLLLGEERSG